MNKKSLAKKILNFKKNKKNISEERSQLNEFLGMDNLNTDENLGKLQNGLSILSSASALIPALRPVAIALSLATTGVNAFRGEADRNATVPSTSGTLGTQQNILRTGLGLQLAGTAAVRGLVGALPFGLAGLATFLGNHATAASRLGGGAMALGSEWIKRISDPASNYLGLPPIPGISDYLTKKQGLGQDRDYDVARSPDRLALINAVNAAR